MMRRKPKAERKESSIHIRVSNDQKQALEEKAKRRGLGYQSLINDLLAEHVRRARSA